MSKRYRSVLYAYLPCCFFNKDQRNYINQKNQQARHLIKEFHSHHSQQQNFIGKNHRDSIMTNGQQHPSRLRAKTLYDF